MKSHFVAILFIILSYSGFSQTGPAGLARLVVDSTLAPFYHGVASGDPLPDAVIIWTRVTTEDLGNINVSWKMATDTLFNNVVANGIAVTNSSKDHTIKVDVTGLQPATYYYYQFEYTGRKSLIGRTKTAPSGDNDHIRFAVVSCSDYENGYFNAYESITFRNDIDAVLHLGDYIYEYEVGGLPGSDRASEPPHEIITLSDYRIRYSHYRLDPQLRGVHQQYPFITTWDDHETANNSWYGGAGNHTPATEGDWFVRKHNGKQAYFEWLPVRESPVDSFRIYRKFQYGDLADVLVLDTRLEARDEQDGTANQDPNRTILGQAQYNWFSGHLHDSTSQWKIVAQQVMMAPLGFGQLTFNEDQWDGYPAERTRLFNEILQDDIRNFVVLTGDIHTSWANDLPGPNYNIFTGAGSVGVEFVTSSITTANADVIGININPAILFAHIKYANLLEHGYVVLDITKNKVQGDWYYVNTIDQIDPQAFLAASWCVEDQERNLKKAPGAATGLANVAPLAPLTVNNAMSGLAAQNDEAIIIGSYPNPFRDQFIVQYFSGNHNKEMQLGLMTMSGTMVYEKIIQPNKGVNYLQINLPDLPAGQYVLLLQGEEYAYRKNVVKVN